MTDRKKTLKRGGQFQKTDRAASKNTPKNILFSAFIKRLANDFRDKEYGESASAPLAGMDYKEELALKEKALMRFWKEKSLPGQPTSPIISSPKSRGYRTTSKRKAILKGSTLYLHFGERIHKSQIEPFYPSALEPEEHSAIFGFLQKKLSEASFRLIAAHLNYLIIRGNYRERAVIFNVDLINGPMVRKLKIVARHLQELSVQVNAAFIYPDPSCSNYYLESRRPTDSINLKNLFGPAHLATGFEKNNYQFHPTSFSQVNESMVPVMLNAAKNLLGSPGGKNRLIDLYCGYGLFSHFMAPVYKEIIGIDAEGPSIRAAAANSKRFKEGGKRRFLAHRITGEVLESVLPPMTGPETIILDPPRQGPLPGVINCLCSRRPELVLHIFCSVDQIPESIREWQNNGYMVSEIVPLDMFPGSANLEVLILLKPAC